MFRMNPLFKSLLLAFMLVVLFAIGGRIVLAGEPDNGEGGLENPINHAVSDSDVEVISIDPDTPFGDFSEDGEGQPSRTDQAFISDEVELLDDPESPDAQFFKRVAGSNFKPRSSQAVYSYTGGGCMQRDSAAGDSWFTIDLQVPDGADIDFMRVYYYDNNATYDINSELWAFDGASGTTLIAEADSSGTPGYGSTGSAFFSHIVDNTNESLVVVASIQGGVGSGLSLCGIRIRYQYNLGASYLPHMLNNATP
jgi:hypothetical protein